MKASMRLQAPLNNSFNILRGLWNLILGGVTAALDWIYSMIFSLCFRGENTVLKKCIKIYKSHLKSFEMPKGMTYQLPKGCAIIHDLLCIKFQAFLFLASNFRRSSCTHELLEQVSSFICNLFIKLFQINAKRDFHYFLQQCH